MASRGMAVGNPPPPRSLCMGVVGTGSTNASNVCLVPMWLGFRARAMVCWRHTVHME